MALDASVASVALWRVGPRRRCRTSRLPHFGTVSDAAELLAERGVEVDHVTIYRWVQRFTPELIDAARPCRHAVSGRWFVDETYVRVAGIWRYVYRAVDQHGR